MTRPWPLAFIAACAILCLTIAARASGEGTAVSHSLKVSVNMETREVAGKDTIRFRRGGPELKLAVRKNTIIDKAVYGNSVLLYTYKDVDKYIKEISIGLPPGKEADIESIDITFHGTFPSIQSERENLTRGVAFVDDGVIGPEGALLPGSSAWYPREATGLSAFEAEIDLPEGYSSITEGDKTGSSVKNGRVVERWRTDKPVDGMDLIAARFVIEKEDYKGIGIYTYFLTKEEALSRLYIEKSKKYIDLYSSAIGPYPFKKFAVVEDFLPTGYGMPSFTLLGSTVLRLPFIPDTSLGHEIAHNWWGNSVFVDTSEGNWAEAITTYVADYRFARDKGWEDAKEFRLSKLRGYKSYAARKGIALKDFKDSTDPAARAVGYNKGLMVFNMLERELGEEAFGKGLRAFYKDFAFKRAAWGDIERSFEKASGRDLKWFFDQWVKRPEDLEIRMEGAAMKKDDQGYTVSFDIRQRDPRPFTVTMPVVIKTVNGEMTKDIRLTSEIESFSIRSADEPVSIEADPDYQAFRVLSQAEVPPSFADLFGDRDAVIVIPNNSRGQERYFNAARTLSKDYNLALMTDAEIGRKDTLRDKSLLIFGATGENLLYTLAAPVLGRHIRFTDDGFEIDGKKFGRAGTVVALAVKNPHDISRTICLIAGDDRDGVAMAVKRLRYFSESSYVVFTGGGPPEKGSFKGKNALGFSFGK